MKKKLETLIQTIRIYSQDIGMKFDIEKCAMLIMRSGKRQEYYYQIKKESKHCEKSKSTWKY